MLRRTERKSQDITILITRFKITIHYNTYVRPLLEHCSPVWAPYHKYLIDKIEHVQRYFTKRIPGMWNISYNNRLILLGLKSLEFRRVVCDLTMCYKILNGYIDTSLRNLFTVKTYQRTRGHDLRLNFRLCSRDISKYMFTNRSIKLWNSLPSHVVHAASVNSFKKNLYTLNGSDFDLNL